jgi:hypothetical protein
MADTLCCDAGNGGRDPTARQARIIAVTEVHERRLQVLRDRVHAAESAEKAEDEALPTELLRLQKRLFDAKFELSASRRAMCELEEETRKSRSKNSDNMTLLHQELKRTHDAMRAE